MKLNGKILYAETIKLYCMECGLGVSNSETMERQGDDFSVVMWNDMLGWGWVARGNLNQGRELCGLLILLTTPLSSSSWFKQNLFISSSSSSSSV